jgi:hypothetical protein
MTVKRLFSIFLAVATLGAMASAQATAPAAPAAMAADPSAQKARKLLDEMVAALGGPVWLNYTTRQEEGRSYSFYHGKPTSAGTLFWRFYEYPDKERSELTKQRDVIEIFNATKGCEKTYKGAAPVEQKVLDEVVRRHSHSLEVVIRQWLRDPRTILMYVGQKVADQQLVDVVSILNADNDEVSIGIDINSHLPINIQYSWRDPDKYKVENEIVFGNYRTVQGIKVPYTITRKRDGEISGQNFLNKVEFNPTFAAGFFDTTVTYDPATYNAHDKKK